jgi:hypothetical protein
MLTRAIPQNFSGGALTKGYTTYFLQLAGLTNAFQDTVILYSIEIVALIAAVYMVEKVGRRPLVLIGTSSAPPGSYSTARPSHLLAGSSSPRFRLLRSTPRRQRLL